MELYKIVMLIKYLIVESLWVVHVITSKKFIATTEIITLQTMFCRFAVNKF